eukprot:Gb_39290 [translate_table: standard]
MFSSCLDSKDKHLFLFESEYEEEAIKFATLHLGVTHEWWIAVMVPDVSERRLTYLFMEGLRELLRGLVKAFDPESLHVAIKRTLTLEITTPGRTFRIHLLERLGVAPSRPVGQQGTGKIPTRKQHGDMTRNEMRRKQLCFNYKEPWDPSHRCLGKGHVHLIKVYSNDEGDPKQLTEARDDVGDETVYGGVITEGPPSS